MLQIPLRSVLFLVLTAVCWGLTLVVYNLIRPNFADGGFLAIPIGSAPSFLYGFGFVIAVAALWPRQPRYPAWGLAGTLVYEAFQPFIAGRTFDVLDLVAGLLGGLLAMAVAHRVPAELGLRTPSTS